MPQGAVFFAGHKPGSKGDLCVLTSHIYIIAGKAPDVNTFVLFVTEKHLNIKRNISGAADRQQKPDNR